MSSPKFELGDRVLIMGHIFKNLNGQHGTITGLCPHSTYKVEIDSNPGKEWSCQEDILYKYVTEEDGSLRAILGTSKDPEVTPENSGGIVKRLEETETLEPTCEHRALLRHYDGYFVTFCPRCGKILHIYHTVKLSKEYTLVEGRIRELEKQKGE